MIQSLLLCCAFFSGDTIPPFGFSGIEVYKASAGCLGLVQGDFNGDGLNDFAMANNDKARIELFLQKSKDKWQEDKSKPPAYSKVNEIHDDARFEKVLIPQESRFFSLVAGDFDGDQTLELAYRGDPPTLTILKCKNDKWEKSQSFKIKEAAGGTDSLLAADLNQDGKTDIAMLSKEGISIFLQNNQNRLDAPTVYPCGLEQATAIAFVQTREGNPSLMITRPGAQNGLAVRTMVGSTLGPEQIFNTGNLTKIFVPETANELGLVAVSGVSGRLSLSRLKSQSVADAVYQAPPALYPLPTEKNAKRRDIAFGDLNGDGLADAVIAQPSAATLDVYLQRKDGLFEPPQKSSTFAGSGNPLVGDFNRDGKMDVLVVTSEERSVGLTSWENGRLEFPKTIAGIVGKPLTATAGSFITAGTQDLAVITDESGNYSLRILKGFSSDVISVPLKFLSEIPTRMIPVDIDGDGDQDLAVISPTDPFGLVMNDGNGTFTPLSSDDFGGKWLLSGAASDSYVKTTLNGGREAILVAKKNLGRAVALDKDRKLTILEQYGAPSEDSNLVALAKSGDSVIALDEKTSTLHALKNQGGDWKSVQEIKIGAVKIERLDFVRLRDQVEPELLLWGASGFQILAKGKNQTTLEPDWSYETAAKDAGLWTMTEGDFNQDGQTDLVVHDWKNRSLEFLNLPSKPGGEISLALRFEIFEEMQMRGGSGSFSIREMLSADLTQDKKDDLLFLLHDRLILYPQE